MKKVLLTLAVAFMAITANAQAWMGGSFGFTSTKDDADAKPVLEYSIAPEVGFAIAPKFDIAVGLSYSGTTYKDKILGQEFKATESVIAIQPYVRYKAINCGKVGFFVDGGFEYGYAVDKLTVGPESDKETSSYFMVGLKPGVSFAASDKITFAARIGSLGYKKIKDGESVFGFGVNNSAFTLGLWWSL